MKLILLYNFIGNAFNESKYYWLFYSESNQVFLQINWLYLVLKLLLHIRLVNHKLFILVAWSSKWNFLHYLFDNWMEASSSKILCIRIHLIGLLSYFLNWLHTKTITSSVKVSFTFSVYSNLTCCMMRLYWGYLRILTSYGLEIGDKPTRIGSLPSSSGIRSSTLAIENDPLAINRIWSVLTSPYLVLTVVP